jgi:DHA2 family multidrug resistance protein
VDEQRRADRRYRDGKPMSAAPKVTEPHALPVTPKHHVNPWVIAGTVSLAAFMEVLDTSIANVALPYMAGGLAASVDDASWVLTSYLVANAVVLPISGWLSTLFGRKRFYMAAVVVFSISSFLCGMAPSLGMLIAFRVLQGAGGGGLQPVSQAILKDTFPAERLGMAFALYGMVVVLAPAIGPTIGGWITDNYQWRWIFYMNIPVGIVSLLLVSRLIEDPPYLVERAKQTRKSISIDYIGIGLLALCLGSLQVVLDRGQEDDWFVSHLITFLALSFVASLVCFLIWELTRRGPVLDLRLFKNRSFAAAAAMIFVYGVQVYAMTVFIPQFHQDELIAHVTPAQQSFRTATDGLSSQLFHRGLSRPQAAHQTLLRIYDAIIAQATVQSYMDVAWLIAVICLLMVPVAMLLKRNDPKTAHVGVE